MSGGHTFCCRNGARPIVCVCLLGCLPFLWGWGCGGGSAKSTAGAKPEGAAEAAPPRTKAATQAEDKSGGQPRTTVSTRDPRTKWINDIPYDVFFDRPLEVASDSTSLATASTIGTVQRPTVTESPAPTADRTKPVEPSAAAGAAGTADWGQLAAIEVLVEETKQIRIRLTTNLQTVAVYNRNIEPIAIDGGVLAALAGVIAQHPGEASWKGKAKFVRELANQVYTSAEGTGSKPFEATKLPFEQLSEVLDGGPAPDIKAEDKVPPSEFADRSAVMKRFRGTFDWLKAEVNTETRLKESAERVLRETTVLATLATVLSDKSYDYAEEDEYQGFIKQFVEANLGMAAAAKPDNLNFADFEAARARVQGTCGACHGKYVGSDAAF